jgi:hypothetical protein
MRSVLEDLWYVMVLAVWILWCGEVVSWGQRVPAVVVSPWCEEVLGVGFVVLVLFVCGGVSDWRAASSLGDILVGALDTGVVVLCHCWCSGWIGFCHGQWSVSVFGGYVLVLRR